MSIEGEIKCLYNEAYAAWKTSHDMTSFMTLQTAVKLVLERRLWRVKTANLAAEVYQRSLRVKSEANAIAALSAHNYKSDLAVTGLPDSHGIARAIHEIAVDNLAKADRLCDDAKKSWDEASLEHRNFMELTSDLITIDECRAILQSFNLI